MISENSIIIKNPNIISTIADDKCVLVPLVDDIAQMKVIHTLNQVGSYIWENINNEKTVNDLINMVVCEFNISKDIATIDIINFFNELEKKQIILI